MVSRALLGEPLATQARVNRLAWPPRRDRLGLRLRSPTESEAATASRVGKATVGGPRLRA